MREIMLYPVGGGIIDRSEFVQIAVQKDYVLIRIGNGHWSALTSTRARQLCDLVRAAVYEVDNNGPIGGTP